MLHKRVISTEQNNNPVIAFFFFLNSLLDNFLVINQVEIWNVCLV